MKKEELKRGKEIEDRIQDLDKMQEWLEDTKNRPVSLIASGCTVNNTVLLSNDMRTVLLGMCIGEKIRLGEEFESL